MTRATTLTDVARLVRSQLPEGRLLPECAWNSRHRAIVWFLWVHVFLLAGYGIARGHGVLHSVGEASALGLFAYFAAALKGRRRLREALASAGLVLSSALLVHFSAGAIEAHFHFFLVIGVLTLYQDWMPFLLALVFIVLHHGLLGVLDPASVYNHADAVAHPWKWAGIHALFVVATSIANLVSWRVNEQLLHEPLTGLPGRTVFHDRLSQSIARLDRTPSTVAVLFVDLDRFKMINDTKGHAYGDRLLVAVAQRLSTTLRRSDSLARMGGDEFAILCQDVHGEPEIVAIAERIAEAVGRPVEVDGSLIATTASVGVALTTDPDTEPEAMMRDADVAMYRAKERGGNCVQVFDPSLHARLLRRMELESGLRQALERDQLKLVYQPEVCLATNRIVAVEALLRWDHPELGAVPPDQFIPIAEDTGMILPIGAWVIGEACRQGQRWRELLPEREPVRMRVNLSPRQLAQPDLVDVIEAALEATRTEPADLDLELTESSIMGEIEWTIVSLRALKSVGVKLSVDDFGTGHSSLSHLKHFPVDTLKVDRSFVRNLGCGETDAAIVGSIVGLAHALGLSVTAEGVEEPGQLADLRHLGCDSAQGFLLARPQTADAVTELLQADGVYGSSSASRA